MDNTVRLWTLLSKQQAAELSGAEQLELKALQEDPSNQEAVASYVRLSHYWKQLADAKQTDTSQYWEQHKAMLTHQAAVKTDLLVPVTEKSLVKRKWQHHKTRLWQAVAAVVIIALGVTLIFRYGGKNIQGDTIIVVHNGAQKQVTLPDGSKVWLNSGSELSYSQYFATGPLKEITLKGEAFFDIRHDPDRTFIIHTQYLDIKDVGTRFNVKAYTYEDKMETTLINGSVEVYPKNHPEQMIRLQPNEKIVFDTKVLRSGKFLNNTKDARNEPLHLDSIESRVTTAGSVAATGFYVARIKPEIQSGGDSIMLETAWMQHQLAFSASTFEDLARNMERWYDVEIDFTNANVASYVFSGIFKEETFQEALNELQMIQPFQYEIQGRKVQIY